MLISSIREKVNDLGMSSNARRIADKSAIGSTLVNMIKLRRG